MIAAYLLSGFLGCISLLILFPVLNIGLLLFGIRGVAGSAREIKSGYRLIVTLFTVTV